MHPALEKLLMPVLRLLVAAIVGIACTSGALPADEPRKQSEPEPIHFGPADWPWWRGPNYDGAAPANQKPPLHWSETENVLWKSPIPGKGHGSPIVLGDRVFLATAEGDSEIQSVLCYDRRSGKQLWRTEVHRGKFVTKGNKKSSQASATPATDGKRIFINFLNDGAVYATALSLDGAQLWQKKISDFVVHQGFGASPSVYGSAVKVSRVNI
jgi:outer membrane protein assembly factor BamB